MSAPPGWLRVERGTPGYPARVERALGSDAPAALAVRGSLALLQRPLAALFCSVGLPGSCVLPSYDVARGLRDAGVAVVGGFHSPMEREWLELLLRGTAPVVVCPALASPRPRLPRAWRAPLDGGRLLVLCAHAERRRRPGTAMAQRRNRMVAALAERVLVLHATPGGRLARVAGEALRWGRPTFCLDVPENQDLRLAGATALDAAGLVAALASPPVEDLQSRVP